MVSNAMPEKAPETKAAGAAVERDGAREPLKESVIAGGYLIGREDAFDFLSAEYAALHDSSAATAFQDGRWLHRLYTVLAPARGATAVVVTVRRRTDRELVLVLPLVRTGRKVRALAFADLGVADYNAIVASSSVLKALSEDKTVVTGIRASLGRFDVLLIDRVANLVDETSALLSGAHKHRHHYDTHVMALASTAEAWRDSLNQTFVRHLDRKYKRLRPKGERVLRQVTDVAEVTSLMDQMRAFRAARFAERRGTDLVQDDDTYAFYLAAAEDSVRYGSPGRLMVMEIAGEPVAIALDLLEADRELFLLVGYDIQRLRNYSLGLLIVDSLAKDAISRGMSSFDLTVGDESYKTDFAAQSLPLHQLRLARTPLGHATVIGNDAYLAARRTAKRALLAWEARKAQRAQKAEALTKPATTAAPLPPQNKGQNSEATRRP